MRKKLTFFRSFKLRIFLIIILTGLFGSVLMWRGILDNYKEENINTRTSEVVSQMKIVANHLISYHYLQDNSSEVINAELSQLSTIYDGRILIVDSNFRIIKDTYGLSEGRYMIAKEVIEGSGGKTITNYDDANHFIEIVVPIISTESDGEAPRVTGVILTSVSTENFAQNYETIYRQARVLETVIMICIVGMAIFVSAIITRPFDKVIKATSEVVSFEDTTPVVSDYIETEQMVDAFNKLRARMKVLDDSRQEFVSNVSHELKTPLTSMKVLADSLNMQEDVPIEMYREFMQDITEEIDRENKIITDLLSLVKMEKGASGMNFESCDINAMLELIIKRLGPIARKQEVDLIFESKRAVTADVDEVKLTLALTNLIENGIKYNRRPGWVKIILDADHQFMSVEVRDSGIGIAESDIDHIFERFYRVDKSHSNEIDGNGLGLAIVKRTVLYHRGSITVDSVIGEGTSFLVKIPLSYIA
ncbi:MAG: sensor histidine kinase [Lachnospiraceae bacterium]